jgi:hypothetical protein
MLAGRRVRREAVMVIEASFKGEPDTTDEQA